MKGRAIESRNLAADFLGKQLHTLYDPYEICIVAYALHVAGHETKGEAFRILQNAKFQEGNQ